MKKGINRLYKDLAWMWPLWGGLEEGYRKESNFFARLIKRHTKIKVHNLLDIGCGGGKNASYFKRHFEVTGIDISKPMLANARKLNPECKFYQGDMRNFDLKRQFDSIFLGDSVNYMTTRKDLLKAFQSAYKHLRAGGVMITGPDNYKETFSQNKTSVYTSKPGDINITFLENSYDPNPKDNTYEVTFTYLIRKNGKLRIEHDFHACGLFSIATWRNSLRKVGFKVHGIKFRWANKDYSLFACVKHSERGHS